MAQFEGVKWAESQMRYLLNNKKQDFLAGNDRVFAVSRSIHYGLFLAFEGIRFFSHKNKDGKLEVIFLNWKKNLERFKRSISFNLSTEQQKLVPTLDELLEIFMNYFKRPDMQNFLEEMAEKKLKDIYVHLLWMKNSPLELLFQHAPQSEPLHAVMTGILGNHLMALSFLIWFEPLE